MASLVLIDSFEKLPDQIMYPYAEPYDLQKHVFRSCPFRRSKFRRPTERSYACDMKLLLLLVFASQAVWCEAELSGEHICPKEETYTVTMRVNVKEPVTIKTYTWCFRIPPRCSKYKVEMRDKFKVQQEKRTRWATACCPGYAPDKTESVCVPVCSTEGGCLHGRCESPEFCTCEPGYVGERCDTECISGMFGEECSKPCECDNNSTCHHVTGQCRCSNGWRGNRCDIPCLGGSYGEDCLQECRCYGSKICNHITGECDRTNLTNALSLPLSPRTTPREEDKTVDKQTYTKGTPSYGADQVPDGEVNGYSVLIKKSKMNNIIAKEENDPGFTTENVSNKVTEFASFDDDIYGAKAGSTMRINMETFSNSSYESPARNVSDHFEKASDNQTHMYVPEDSVVINRMFPDYIQEQGIVVDFTTESYKKEEESKVTQPGVMEYTNTPSPSDGGAHTEYSHNHTSTNTLITAEEPLRLSSLETLPKPTSGELLDQAPTTVSNDLSQLEPPRDDHPEAGRHVMLENSFKMAEIPVWLMNASQEEEIGHSGKNPKTMNLDEVTVGQERPSEESKDGGGKAEDERNDLKGSRVHSLRRRGSGCSPHTHSHAHRLSDAYAEKEGNAASEGFRRDLRKRVGLDGVRRIQDDSAKILVMDVHIVILLFLMDGATETKNTGFLERNNDTSDNNNTAVSQTTQMNSSSRQSHGYQDSMTSHYDIPPPARLSFSRAIVADKSTEPIYEEISGWSGRTTFFTFTGVAESS
uniref:EMI domain-containing protein n=1 Tax=Timema shepardi TaxID=629360 RepID=A0A7R9FWM1_TIMSH|nr:unnamed protein product [Timema shepardi]